MVTVRRSLRPLTRRVVGIAAALLLTSLALFSAARLLGVENRSATF